LQSTNQRPREAAAKGVQPWFDISRMRGGQRNDMRNGKIGGDRPGKQGGGSGNLLGILAGLKRSPKKAWPVCKKPIHSKNVPSESTNPRKPFGTPPQDSLALSEARKLRCQGVVGTPNNKPKEHGKEKERILQRTRGEDLSKAIPCEGKCDQKSLETQ